MKYSKTLIALMLVCLSACQVEKSSSLVTSTSVLAAREITATVQPDYTPSPIPSATPVPVEKLVVTTELDIVDGDASSCENLRKDLGPDGSLSLREAILASNQTVGQKQITFDPSLKDRVILLGSAQRYSDPRLIITGENININGDINEDGKSDIIIDGSALAQNHSTAFILSSRYITLQNLTLQEFQDFAIIISCTDNTCSTKPFHHIQILNNQINSSTGGGGVKVFPFLTTSEMSDPAQFSEITISDIEIGSNTIQVNNGKNEGILMMAAGAGGSNNHLINISITDNIISSPGATITISAAYGSSAYYGFSGPEKFSDKNMVENIVIDSNTLDPQGSGRDNSHPAGIVIFAGNDGNSDNTMSGIVISNNVVSSNSRHAVVLFASNNVYIPGFPISSRAPVNNVIENIVISGNLSNAWDRAIWIYAASGDDPMPVGATGRISHVKITENLIQGYKFEGIMLNSGIGESNNLVEDVLIKSNEISSLDPAKGLALFIIGGGGDMCKRTSQKNAIMQLVIQNNTINSGNTLYMYGGVYDHAMNNLIEYYFGENMITFLDVGTDIKNFLPQLIKDNNGNRVIELDSIP
jgi:hypothetical protein